MLWCVERCGIIIFANARVGNVTNVSCYEMMSKTALSYVLSPTSCWIESEAVRRRPAVSDASSDRLSRGLNTSSLVCLEH